MASGFDLDQFRSKLQSGGARPSLFEMQITFPSGVGGSRTSNEARFLTKVSEIPASTLGVITVPYFGRQLKIAGDRTFATLSCTIINDENYFVRSSFEQWMNIIASHDTAVGAEALDFYQRELVLTQLTRGKAPSAQYNFASAFPTGLGSIALDWSSTDAIEDYTVEFQYQYWTSNFVPADGSSNLFNRVNQRGDG
jgi:hypothetical protein